MLDQASRDWRGVVLTPVAVRQLQDPSRELETGLRRTVEDLGVIVAELTHASAALYDA